MAAENTNPPITATSERIKMSPWKTRKRYRKGCFMRLKSVELLRAFVVMKDDVEAHRAGKEVEPKMTQRFLAEKAGVHPSFINHLTSGRKKSCDPPTAERIASALGVPTSVLFMLEEPTDSCNKTNQQTSMAA